MAKPRIGVFKFTSCSGCQLSILNLENELLSLLGAVELAYFVMARRDNQEGPYDIALVEGSVSTPRELAELKKIRAESKLLVAFGTCAVTGNIQSIKNHLGTQREMEEKSRYTELWDIHSFPTYGLDYYVKVDQEIRGCAPDTGELMMFFKSALLGITPPFRPHAVCNECKLKENICLLITKKQPCMGPVSAGGCGALCPSLNRLCEGCRGPAVDCNAPALARLFHNELGLSKEDVIRKFRKYAGNELEWQKGVETRL